MANLTPDEFRQVQPTNVPTARLQDFIDAAYSAIASRYGDTGANYSLTRRSRYQQRIFLDRPASAVVSATEYFADPIGIGGVLLNANDYVLAADGITLERYGYGTNPADYWADRVDLVLTPMAFDAERRRAAIALVKLDLNFAPGLTSVNLGGQYATGQDTRPYAVQREEILDTLAGATSLFA